jgi:hypothetical protein
MKNRPGGKEYGENGEPHKNETPPVRGFLITHGFAVSLIEVATRQSGDGLLRG